MADSSNKQERRSSADIKNNPPIYVFSFGNGSLEGDAIFFQRYKFINWTVSAKFTKMYHSQVKTTTFKFQIFHCCRTYIST